MRNFIKEAFDAAEKRSVIQAPEFSWSLSRKSLFSECRTKYFIHYYLASGGWDVYADDLSAEAWRLKKETPLNVKYAELCMEAIFKALKSVAYMKTDIRLLRFPDIFEHNIAAVAAESRINGFYQAAQNFFSEFRKTDTYKLMVAFSRYAAGSASPLMTQFICGNIKVFCRQGICWNEPGNGISYLNVGFSPRSAEREQEIADVTALASPGRIAAVYFFAPDDAGGWEEKTYTGNAVYAEEMIKKSAGEMLEMEQNGAVYQDEFINGMTSACSACKYVKICIKLNGQIYKEAVK